MVYDDSLVYDLREYGKLGRYQRHIHVLTPKQVRKFKDSYSALPKNDYVDAFVIADHLRFGRIASEVYTDDYRYRSLQTLTRARFDAVQSLTREKQKFAICLFLKCSGIVQDKEIFNTSATTLALMEAFESVDNLANCDLETLTAFVTVAGSLIQKLRHRRLEPLPKLPTDFQRRSTTLLTKLWLYLLHP